MFKRNSAPVDNQLFGEPPLFKEIEEEESPFKTAGRYSVKYNPMSKLRTSRVSQALSPVGKDVSHYSPEVRRSQLNNFRPQPFHTTNDNRKKVNQTQTTDQTLTGSFSVVNRSTHSDHRPSIGSPNALKKHINLKSFLSKSPPRF